MSLNRCKQHEKKLFILSLFLLIVNCSKSSDPKTETEPEIEPEFDINEGQTNWTKYEYSGVNDSALSIGVNDIAIQDETVVMVGSADYGETSGRIWKSSDSGETWEVIAGGGGGCGAGSAIHDVDMPKKNVIFAYAHCGNSQSNLFKSIDGGGSWEILPLPVLVFGNQTSRPLYFFDETTGFFTNYKTVDGGSTWSEIPDLEDYIFPNKIFSIYFLDNEMGYCNTQTTILKTENRGDNWSVIYEDSNGTFRDIYFIDSDIGFVSTETELLKTSDGGQNWSPVLSETIRDISFATEEVGFAVGVGGIYKTIDTGNTWNLNYETSFITLEECCGDYYKTNGFNAIVVNQSGLGMAAGFQNRNRNPDEDNLPNEKAYITRTTTLGE